MPKHQGNSVDICFDSVLENLQNTYNLMKFKHEMQSSYPDIDLLCWNAAISAFLIHFTAFFILWRCIMFPRQWSRMLCHLPKDNTNKILTISPCVITYQAHVSYGRFIHHVIEPCSLLVYCPSHQIHYRLFSLHFWFFEFSMLIISP